jgi:signal transduction histidine kinase
MRDVRLRTLLALSFAGVAFVATLAAYGVSLWATGQKVDDWSAQRVERTATAAAVAVGDARMTEGWPPAVRNRLARELPLSGLDYRLRDADGRVVFETADVTRRGDAAVPVTTRVVPGGSDVLEVFTINRPGAQSTADEIATRLEWVHLFAKFSAALLASLVGCLIAGRLAGPLQRLAAIAPGLSRADPAPVIPQEGPREVRDVATAIDDLARDLRRQRTARVQLAQDLAHELRAPLAVAQARLEAIEDGLVPLDQVQVASVRAEVVRLGRLLGEIERLADAEVSPRELSAVPVDLAEIARRQEIVVVGADHPFGLDPGPATAVADPNAVEQIVANLVANGLRHGPPGGRIELRTGTTAGEAWLRVIDAGSGVPDGEAAFRRFHRGTTAAADDGFGLGLAIARELATALGGSLCIDADAAQTTFVLALPAAAAHERRAERPDGSTTA